MPPATQIRIHGLARLGSTLTSHEAARLQFLPDFMDLSGIARRSDLARTIDNAPPPILTIAVVRALIEQSLVGRAQAA